MNEQDFRVPITGAYFDQDLREDFIVLGCGHRRSVPEAEIARVRASGQRYPEGIIGQRVRCYVCWMEKDTMAAKERAAALADTLETEKFL